MITAEKTVDLKWHIVSDSRISVNSTRTTNIHYVTYRFFEIHVVKVMMSHTPLLQTFFSYISIFCVNSNYISQIIKKAVLSLIRLRNWKYTSYSSEF